MTRILSFLLFVFLSIVASSSHASPFSLDIQKQYKDVPVIQDFKYWYGDVNYGFAVYIGTRDLSGFETELQIHFSGKLITKATLVLGPGGINSVSCISDYKKVVRILNKKYGHFTHQNIIKDPLYDDLIAINKCSPILNELYTVFTYWKAKAFDISSTLLGDDDGYYIEVEYTFRNVADRSLNDLRKSL